MEWARIANPRYPQEDNFANPSNRDNSKNNPDIDIVNNPDLISTDDNLAVLSGMWYFKKKVLSQIKDFDNKATVEKVTQKINKYTNSTPQRDELFKKSQNSINCNN